MGIILPASSSANAGSRPRKQGSRAATRREAEQQKSVCNASSSGSCQSRYAAHEARTLVPSVDLHLAPGTEFTAWNDIDLHHEGFLLRWWATSALALLEEMPPKWLAPNLISLDAAWGMDPTP